MYISPYIVGGVAVLIVEFLFLIAYAIYENYKHRNNRR